MQRDMDLIRVILMEIEQHQNPMTLVRLETEGYSPDQAAYHVKLLTEAGLIEALDCSTMGRMDWRPRSLTWHGHEFLDATRNAGVWHKVKAELKDRGTALPFTLIQQLALKIAAAHFGLGSGK